jgi:hypothetical protein
LAEAGADVAHFAGANAGESGGEEEQHGVLPAEILTQLDVHQTGGVLGFESEVWSLGTNFNRHKFSIFEVWDFPPIKPPMLYGATAHGGKRFLCAQPFWRR